MKEWNSLGTTIVTVTFQAFLFTYKGSISPGRSMALHIRTWHWRRWCAFLSSPTALWQGPPTLKQSSSKWHISNVINDRCCNVCSLSICMLQWKWTANKQCTACKICLIRHLMSKTCCCFQGSISTQPNLKKRPSIKLCIWWTDTLFIK